MLLCIFCCCIAVYKRSKSSFKLPSKADEGVGDGGGVLKVEQLVCFGLLAEVELEVAAFGFEGLLRAF